MSYLNSHLIIALGLAAALIAPLAAAQSPMQTPLPKADEQGVWAIMNYTWKLKGQQTRQTGSRFKKEQVKPIKMEIAYVSNAVRPGQVALNCVQGQPQLAVTMSERLPWQAYEKVMFLYNTKNADVEVISNGEVQPTAKWGYYKRTKSLYAFNTLTTKLFYNHIIRRDNVQIRYKGNLFDVELPEPNTNFANWGAECGLGLLAKTG